MSVVVKKDRLETEFYLGREAKSSIITGRQRISANRVAHKAVLHSPDEITAELIWLLRESYLLVSGVHAENKSGS
jgi:hypothetical protein